MSPSEGLKNADDNVFGRSRRKLTFYYAALMAVFLIVLVFIVHRSMNWAITSEEAKELIDTANNLSLAQSRIIQHREEDVNDDVFDIKSMSDRIFFYAFDKKGTMLSFARPAPDLEDFVLSTVSQWQEGPDEVTLYIRREEDREQQIMMTSHPVMIEMEPMGMVYVGKDVTTIYAGMRKATYTLTFVAFLALLIATVIGYLMAGKAMEPLQEAYATQRQFAADASHELRTPLAVVMASCDILENDPNFKEPFLRQIVADVRDEVKKMTRLVGDLLFVARSDNQAIKLMPRDFDLAAVAAQTLRLMQPLAEEKNITLALEGAESVPVRADEEKIGQLMLIFVDNAIKYTNPGGHVTVSLPEPVKGKINFSVTDTGIGIAPADLNRIFDRFYRVDKARSREMGGNGLGLAIAHELAELYHGNIKVKSNLGQGTTFTVSLRDNSRNRNIIDVNQKGKNG